MSNRFSVNAAGQLVCEADGKTMRVNMAQSVEKIADALNLATDLATLDAYSTRSGLGWSIARFANSMVDGSALYYCYGIDNEGDTIPRTGATYTEAVAHAAEWARVQEAVSNG